MSNTAAVTAEEPGALALLAQVDALLDKVNAEPLWTAPGADALAMLERLAVVEAKVAAARLTAVQVVDVSGAAVAAGAASTAGWLRGLLRMDPGAAARMVALARSLDTSHPATGAALAAGAITEEHVRVVAHVLDAVPEVVDAGALAAVEEHLIAEATVCDPRRLAAVGRTLGYCLDPGGELALAEEEALQVERRWLRLSRRRSGAWDLRGRLDSEAGAEMHTMIESLAKPRPRTDAGPDPRTADQRCADAAAEMVQLARTSPGISTSGGHRPTLLVEIPYETLVGRAGCGPGTFLDGHPLSAGAARRLACDAEIIPVVLGGASQPLDIGRTAYTPPIALRRAVLMRDKHRCATPHCGGLPRHVHHIVHWVDDGPTALDNLVSLCGHCHRAVHRPEPRWVIAVVPGGRPRFARAGPAPQQARESRTGASRPRRGGLRG